LGVGRGTNDSTSEKFVATTWKGPRPTDRVVAPVNKKKKKKKKSPNFVRCKLFVDA
jgi:hypothetical protein